MDDESVWLGRLRQPVRLAAIAFAVLAAAMAALLIAGQFTAANPIGMYELLRPEGRPQVQAMLVLGILALLFVALYLSDTIGSIEPRPTGMMDTISLVFSRVAMVGIVCVVVVMFYEVVARYVFEKPTLWANELSLWIAGFVFMFAGLYAMQQRSHIRIYIIYDMMPLWMRKLSDCVSVALIWVFLFCLVWGGFNEAWAKFMRMETFGTAWDPPIPATIKPGILIIITLVAIQALTNLIADWHKVPEHHSPADDIDEIEIEKIRAALKDRD